MRMPAMCLLLVVYGRQPLLGGTKAFCNILFIMDEDFMDETR